MPRFAAARRAVAGIVDGGFDACLAVDDNCSLTRPEQDWPAGATAPMMAAGTVLAALSATR
jgi:hypothetical protein